MAAPSFDFTRLPSIAVDASSQRLAQPFKLPYTNLDDVRKRFLSTLIQINREPYFVMGIHPLAKDFIFVLSDENDQVQGSVAYYSTEHLDLRPIPGRYVHVHGRVGFLCRAPIRQQYQGLNGGNAWFQPVGGDTGRWAIEDLHALIPGLRDNAVLTWSPTLHDIARRFGLMGFRLSNDIAVSHKKELKCEFRGRTLGPIHDDTVKLNAADNRPWITRAVADTGLQIKVVK